MLFETEIKIRLKNKYQLDTIRDKCEEKAKGKEVQEFQHDEYYDTKDELLKKEDLTIRLRRLNDNVKLAMKGPRKYIVGKMYKRIELEFNIPDENEILEQLKSQELIAAAVVEKRRTNFIIDNCTVTIDELPFIGAFVEIEADDSKIIAKIMKFLKLSENNSMKENYSELLEKKFAKIGLPIRPNLKATFESEEQYKSRYLKA